MKNRQIGVCEKKQIDKAVSRLLTDLRGVELPLNLANVRGQLNLDLEYYSSRDPSRVKQIVHSIKMAGKELLDGKNILGRMIAKFGLKGMLFWDQNRILIDQDLHQAKHRWTQGHEIGHKLLFWHKHYLLGDSKNELSLDCHATIEAEANYAAGQLLFHQGLFVEEMMSRPVSIVTLKYLTARFGNSNASTFWRMVEEYRGVKSIVGIVSEHPHRLPDDFDFAAPCRYTIQSPFFRARFSRTTEALLFERISSYCDKRSGGPIGSATLPLIDDNGDAFEFKFESFCFRFANGASQGFQVLTLGIENSKMRSRRILVPVDIAIDCHSGRRELT
jgi:hypothetical protein